MLKCHDETQRHVSTVKWGAKELAVRSARIVPRYHEANRIICSVLIYMLNMLKLPVKTQ